MFVKGIVAESEIQSIPDFENYPENYLSSIFRYIQSAKTEIIILYIEIFHS